MHLDDAGFNLNGLRTARQGVNLPVYRFGEAFNERFNLLPFFEYQLDGYRVRQRNPTSVYHRLLPGGGVKLALVRMPER